MKYILVAGARPNFMKVAPIAAAFRARRQRIVLVHTGQHYGREMSESFFSDLDITRPDVNPESAPGRTRNRPRG